MKGITFTEQELTILKELVAAQIKLHLAVSAYMHVHILRCQERKYEIFYSERYPSCSALRV